MSIRGIPSLSKTIPLYYKNTGIEMNDEQLQELISEKSDKLIAKLEWHDTLDVQNAVRKAFSKGFKDGIEYNKESLKVMVKEMVKEGKPKTTKSKKTSSKKKKVKK